VPIVSSSLIINFNHYKTATIKIDGQEFTKKYLYDNDINFYI
jgi:hypothetical protein